MRISDRKISLWIILATLASVLGSLLWQARDGFVSIYNIIISYKYEGSAKIFFVGQQLEEEVFLITIATLSRYLQFHASAILCESLLILSFGKLYDYLNGTYILSMPGDYFFFILMFLWAALRIIKLKMKGKKTAAGTT